MSQPADASDPRPTVPAVPSVPAAPGTEPSLEPLVELIRILRGPGGCAWDREQTLASVRAYLLEEAHEAAAALDEEDHEALAEELGDLLFQVVFVGVLLEEAGGPGPARSIRRVFEKMVRRHPHVFDPQVGDRDAAEVARAWERSKARERGGDLRQDGRKKAGDEPADASLLDASLLDGVPASLPALVASYRLTQKAAGVGFDWPDVEGVLAKVREELGEVEEELESATEEASKDASKDALREEIGDLLFSVANLARHLDLDPEAALAGCNRKFRRRFAHVEEGLRATGRSVADAELDEMDALWEESKRGETRGES